MKNIIITGITLALNFMANGQETFHKLIYFEFPLTRFTSILPTDSCYYLSATFVDSISPVRTGVMFAKVDIHGDYQFSKTLQHADRRYYNDYSDLLATTDGNFIKAGNYLNYGDSVDTFVNIIKYTPDGDTLFTKIYDSILYPELSYLITEDFRPIPGGGYAVLISHEANETPNQSDISLLLLNPDFNIIDYLTYANTPSV